MKGIQNFFTIFMALILIFSLFQCGMIDNKSADEVFDFFNQKDAFQPDDAIPAMGIDTSKQIRMFIWDGGESGTFREIVDGSYVQPYTQQILGIQVDERIVGDEVMDQRVFVSDGGSNFHVEAYLDENGEYYLCHYTFQDAYSNAEQRNIPFVTYPLLVQVIYPDNKASKKKVVLTTRKNLRPDSGNLVKNGLGVSLSEKALDCVIEQVQNLVSTVDITEFKPATTGDSIFHVGIGTSLGADMELNDTYTDDQGEEVRGLKINLALSGGDGGSIVDAFIDLALKLFNIVAKPAELLNITLGPVSIPLKERLSGLGGSDDSSISGLMQKLELDSILFLNLFGLPDDTDSQFAVIGGGLYAEDGTQVETNIDGKNMWPEVTVDPFNTQIDIDKIKTPNTDIGLALSQYNLNRMLSDMMQSLRIVIGGESLGKLKNYITPESPSDTLELALSINPHGIAIDMTDSELVPGNTAVLAVNDMHLEVLEDSAIKALASLDLTLKLGIDICVEGGEYILKLQIEPIYELCHVNLIYDNKSIGILDHTGLMKVLFRELAKVEEGEPLVVPISLSKLGLIPANNNTEAGKIDFDGKGNCFMNLALESIDTSNLGICFISSITQKEDTSSTFSLEKLMKKTDAIIQEKISGSVLGKPKEGNYAVFKNATFNLKGNYQINGVYYRDRDINGYNGNNTVWDSNQNMNVRNQTNEVEAFMYHDLTLNPMIEFNGGMVTFHASLYAGGYMWEMDYPNVVYHEDLHNKGFNQSVLDYQKIHLRSAFMEMVTPLGMIVAGQLPEDLLGMNLNGVFWGIAVPPLPFWTFLLGYAVKNEGANKFGFEHREGISYMDTINDEDYQDKDDQTIYAIAGMFDNKETLDGLVLLGSMRGGSGSPATTNANVILMKGKCNYNKGHLKVYAELGTKFGTKAPLTTNVMGEPLRDVPETFNDVLDQLDPEGDTYRRVDLQAEDLVYSTGLTFFTLVNYKMGQYIPEVGLMYCSGGNNWYETNFSFSRAFEPEANRTPRPNVKAYLLNEIEDKYYPLISNFSTLVATRDTEVISYQNMSLIKAGATYRISEHFEVFGQALAAWRTNVSYYEEDYWDTYFLIHFYTNRSYTSSPDGEKLTMIPALLQDASVEYHQNVDPFLGLEFNGKLTWFARKGLEISLIGAYFHTGDFYKDLLTPKKYLRQVAYITSQSSIILDGNISTFFGPNESAPIYQNANAWTIQLKFDFKFQ